MDHVLSCEPSKPSGPIGTGQWIHAHFAWLGGVELALTEADGLRSGGAPADMQPDCSCLASQLVMGHEQV
jgi:hypothetical protein